MRNEGKYTDQFKVSQTPTYPNIEPENQNSSFQIQTAEEDTLNTDVQIIGDFETISGMDSITGLDSETETEQLDLSTASRR